MARRLREEAMEYTAELLALGGKTSAVTADVAAHFAMSPRNARRYIAATRQRFRTEGSIHSNERRSQLRLAAEVVFREARALAHWKTCLNTLRFLADLDGVMAPTQLQVQHSSALGEGTITSLEALTERVEELRKTDDAVLKH